MTDEIDNSSRDIKPDQSGNDLENSSILSMLNVGSWRLDLLKSTWFFSERLFDLFDHPASLDGQVPASFWQEKVASSELRKVAKFIALMSEDNETHEVIVSTTLPAESRRFIKLQGKAVKNSENRVVEAAGLAFDVSDEIATRRELENQKSLASHQARLASIGELAAGVGHEINNPLTIIRGFIEIIKNQLGSSAPRIDEIIELVSKMDDSAGRIEKIVRGLRSLSHVDVSGSEYFSPDQILRDTVGFVDEIYRRHGVSLEMISNVPSSARLRGHEGKLQQVVMNLLSNARDATEGQIERRIAVHFFVEGDNLFIKVQDNGPGVGESIKERIFHPFFTTKDIGKGTGIGLSMVHSIVSEFSGSIACFDSPPGGAEFVVNLPLEKERKPSSVESAGDFSADNAFSGRVLVVDDEDGVREFLLLMLSQIGLTVETASNGQQALDEIFKEEKCFDAVITDLTMPGMGGLELVRELQTRVRDQPMPKVLLPTGLPDFSFDEEAFPQVVGVLHKPFNLERLRQMLELAL